jgi:hypothetical protein
VTAAFWWFASFARVPVSAAFFWFGSGFFAAFFTLKSWHKRFHLIVY